jgi:hypothetical protein
VVYTVVESRKHTVIVVRRVLTEPKIALTGAILEVISARFMASMAAFNAEVTPSRPLSCWDSAFMVGTRGICENTWGLNVEGYEEGLLNNRAYSREENRTSHDCGQTRELEQAFIPTTVGEGALFWP